jgi:pyridoxamine 5'-phosphate oxidase
MNEQIAQLRQEYYCLPLQDDQLDADPLSEFSLWFAKAVEMEPFEANAMSLATADAQGRPSVRIVLLKELDERGFTFFTNYESRKGRELREQSWASLLFYWPRQHRQVRIEGDVEMLTESESDAYFASRPRGSQIGAWVSSQSQPVSSRAMLERCRAELEQNYRDQPVLRPPHWGGYRLVPQNFEFWQGQPDRLHDRISYQRDEQGWVRTRLQP